MKLLTDLHALTTVDKATFAVSARAGWKEARISHLPQHAAVQQLLACSAHGQLDSMHQRRVTTLFWHMWCSCRRTLWRQLPVLRIQTRAQAAAALLQASFQLKATLQQQARQEAPACHCRRARQQVLPRVTSQAQGPPTQHSSCR